MTVISSTRILNAPCLHRVISPGGEVDNGRVVAIEVADIIVDKAAAGSETGAHDSLEVTQVDRVDVPGRMKRC